MRIRTKSRRTKHGAASVFLAIVLSALILVECTFVAFVWNLDYALSVNTALKTEVDTILSDYNRQLFDVYGIYAFSIDGVDDECFNRALEINGYEAESQLFVSGKHRFTAADLKKAIKSYYWYRGTGIKIRNVVDSYSELFIQLDEKGIIKDIGQFMKSPAAEYISQMIKGSESAEKWIEKAGDVLNIDDLIEESEEMDELRSDYQEAIKDFGLDIDVDISQWNSVLKGVSFLERVSELGADNSPEALTKFYVSNYCAYNFDCAFRPKGDSSINGTDFDSIHGKKRNDCEYILTGEYGAGTLMEIETMMVGILIAGCFLTDYADEVFRNTMYAIAEVISAIILAVSEGTVDIDPRIIQVGLTFYCAVVQSFKEFIKVTVRGERAVIFKYEDTDIITLSYRDFLYLFCICTPEEELLDRSLEVLKKDYGKLYKGIRLEAEFGGNTYSIDKSYQLYE